MPRMRIRPLPGTFDRRWLTPIQLVCIIFIALGAVYSVMTPIFEASDELYHYPYIKHIADGNGLPIQSPGNEQNRWNQEGSQPPLYYVLGALATFWINTGDAADIYWRNPHATIGMPNAVDNKNMVVHTGAEAFPYRGVPLAVHIIRFLSVLMGTGTIYFTYLIALELLPGRQLIAIGAAAVNALIPQFLFISGSINNDNLITLLGSLGLLLVVRALKNGLAAHRVLALSMVVGLASLSKLSGLGLLGLIVVAALLDAARAKSWRLLIRWTAPATAATVVIGGWWYLRNWLLYGDLLGLNVWLQIAGERPEKPGIIQLLLSESEGFKMSFWAVFGGFNVLADKPVYWFYDVLTVISVVGLAVAAIRCRKHAPEQGTLFLVSAAWIGILGVSLLRWTQMTLASQGRLMFPAISVVAIALFLGIYSAVPRRLATAFVICAGIAMFSVAVVIPFRSIAPVYAQPSALSEKEVPASSQPLHVNFQGKAELLGYEMSKNRLKAGEDLDVTLYWKSLSQFDKNYSAFVHLFGRDNEPIGQSDSFPGGGAFATRLWRIGDVVPDRHRITISPSAKAPSTARIETGLYLLPTFEMLQAADPSGKPIGPSPRIATAKVAGEGGMSSPAGTEIALFEDKIAFIGGTVQRASLAPGDALSGSLTWRAEMALDEDLTVFVQLVGEDGLAAQYDSQPVRGFYPTSLWERGEVIEDTFEMKLDPQVREGNYDLIVGLYRLKGGARLKVNNDTFVRFARITVDKSK